MNSNQPPALDDDAFNGPNKIEPVSSDATLANSASTLIPLQSNGNPTFIQTDAQPAMTTAAQACEPDEEPQWWQDPNLPWEHKPTKEELTCYGFLTFYGLFGLVMLPLRAWMLTVPVFSALFNGSRTAVAAVGAFTATGKISMTWGVVIFVLAALSAIKWDWIYWWCGKLWGKAFIDNISGRNKLAKRFSAALESFTIKHPVASLFLTYLPIPLIQVIYVALGSVGMRIKKFVIIDFLVALIFYTGYFFLGHLIGQSAVKLLEIYAQYATKIAIGLTIAVVAWVIFKTFRQAKTSDS